MADPTYLLWIDLETDGLWTHHGPPAVLEVGAALLPYGDFDVDHVQFTYSRVTGAAFSPSDVEVMDDFVRNMHTESGLLDEALNSTASLRVAELEILQLLHDNGVERRTVSFAGSGIAPFDVPLLREYMFDLYDFAHYAPYDVGTGRRMLRMIEPGLDLRTPDNSAGDGKQHRALDDVLAHIAEAAHYASEFELRPRNR